MGEVGGVVATLIVDDQHQRTCSIHDWPGDDARDQQAHLAQRQRRRLFLELLSYPHQEMMRQHDQYHMMIPPGEIGLRRGYHALHYGSLNGALLGLRVVIIVYS